MNYSVLVVDPPWSYGKPTVDRGASRNCAVKYAGGTMSVDDIIIKTPVQQMAAPNSHLYLWTTNPKLPFAFNVMRAWGFEYKTTLTRRWKGSWRRDGLVFPRSYRTRPIWGARD